MLQLRLSGVRQFVLKSRNAKHQIGCVCGCSLQLFNCIANFESFSMAFLKHWKVVVLGFVICSVPCCHQGLPPRAGSALPDVIDYHTSHWWVILPFSTQQNWDWATPSSHFVGQQRSAFISFQPTWRLATPESNKKAVENRNWRSNTKTNLKVLTELVRRVFSLIIFRIPSF